MSSNPPEVRGIGITLIACVAIIWLLRSAQEVIIPFVLSGLLFSALEPLVFRLESWRVPRPLGAAFAIFLVLAATALTAFSLSDEAIKVIHDLPVGVRKLRSELLSRNEQPSTFDRVKQAAEELDRTAAEATSQGPVTEGVVRVQVEESPFRLSDYLWSGGTNVAAFFGLGLMVVFLTYFLLISGDLLKRKLVKNVGATLSEKKVTIQIVDEIGSQIGRFLLVQLFTSCIVGIVTGLTLWMLGLKQAAAWGLLAGVLNSIPYFGPIVVTVGLALVGFLQFGTIGKTAAVAGAALVITTLEGWVLTPTLMGRVAQMNRIAIFAGLLFWSWMWGIWGVLLAIPMMMVVKTVCDRIEGLRPIGDFLGE